MIQHPTAKDQNQQTINSLLLYNHFLFEYVLILWLDHKVTNQISCVLKASPLGGGVVRSSARDVFPLKNALEELLKSILTVALIDHYHYRPYSFALYARAFYYFYLYLKKNREGTKFLFYFHVQRKEKRKRAKQTK